MKTPHRKRCRFPDPPSEPKREIEDEENPEFDDFVEPAHPEWFDDPDEVDLWEEE